MHDKQEINLLLEIDPVTGVFQNYKIIRNLKDLIKKSNITLIKTTNDCTERVGNCDCCSNPLEIFLYRLDNDRSLFSRKKFYDNEELEMVAIKEEEVFVEPIIPFPVEMKEEDMKVGKRRVVKTKKKLKKVPFDEKELKDGRKKMGRPFGSKNKPKDPDAEVVVKKKKSIPIKNEAGYFVCKDCKTEYDTVKSFKCHTCNGTYLGKYKTTETPACGYCGKKYGSWGTARSHEKTYHEGAVNYTCEVCGYTTKHKQSFADHLIIDHKGKKQFICDICQYRSSNRSGMKSHMKLKHLKIGIHVCEICAKTFPNAERLKCHKTHIHSNERKFQCGSCDKAFKTKINLNAHVFKIHTPLELKTRYDCEQCEFSTYCNKSFKGHQGLHVDTEKCPYKCNVCHRGFVSKHRFRDHQNSHSDERPFKCEFCEKAFRRKADCKVHMRYHTGEKPYECEICKQRYSDRGCYRSHLLVHEKQLGVVLDKSVKKFWEKPVLLPIVK